MKNRKKKYSENYIIFNENWTYQIPMIPLSNKDYDMSEDYTDIKISQERGFIHAAKPGFRDKFFTDRYFEFLISTGYVKVIRNVN